MFGINRNYNYERFTKEMMARDMNPSVAFEHTPEPGDRAPDFEARSLDGENIRLRDLRDKTNVVLTFGSATCPMTAGSIGGLKQLYREYDGDEVKFLFVYVREAHPGDEISSHHSIEEKMRAAEVLRDEEDIELPILIDDLRGTIHRKYGSLANPTFIIDKSGRIAFRALWTQASVLKEGLDQLLNVQRERGVDHAVVLGGEDTSMPMSYPVLFSYRALRRGGTEAIVDFEQALGLRGRVAVASSRLIGPVAENPGKSVAAAVLGLGVVAAGVYAGRALRRRRFANRNPYAGYIREAEEESSDVSDYGAVGI